MKYVLSMLFLLAGGCARGGPLNTVDSQPFDPSVVVAGFAAAADGKWWCFDIHNPGDTDALAYCRRSRSLCEGMRREAHLHKKEPGECKSQETAFCFDLSVETEIVEICTRTEPQCKQRELHARKNFTIVAKCSERRNDKPPSGDVAGVYE